MSLYIVYLQTVQWSDTEHHDWREERATIGVRRLIKRIRYMNSFNVVQSVSKTGAYITHMVYEFVQRCSVSKQN